jgi:hypothetical protein
MIIARSAGRGKGEAVAFSHSPLIRTQYAAPIGLTSHRRRSAESFEAIHLRLRALPSRAAPRRAAPRRAAFSRGRTAIATAAHKKRAEGRRGNTRGLFIRLRNPPIGSGKILSRNRERARRVSIACALARRFGTNVALALR